MLLHCSILTFLARGDPHLRAAAATALSWGRGRALKTLDAAGGGRHTEDQTCFLF